MSQKCKGCGETHAEVDPKKVQEITDRMNNFIEENKFNELESMVACGVIANQLQQKHSVVLKLYSLTPDDNVVH